MFRQKAGAFDTLPAFCIGCTMNKRLKLITKHITGAVGVIDVGTDHGYLPIALAECGYKGNIIASDINSDPLNKAIYNATQAGLYGKIQFRLSDGLSGCCPEEVDTIVIAGMGGDTICGILDRAEWCMAENYKLILQPMTKAEILRYWLINNGFVIRSEERVKENGTIYQIIVTSFEDNSTLTDAELFTGAAALRKDEYYAEELDIFIKRFVKAADGMKNIPRKHPQRKLYLSIISQLEKMRSEYEKTQRDI